MFRLMNCASRLGLIFFAAWSSQSAWADHHASGEVNATSNGTVEAAQLTLCALNPGSTLADAENLIPDIQAFQKEAGYTPFFGILTPMFVSPQSKIDFILADFAPFADLAAAWETFLQSSSGAKVQASIDDVATCTRTLHRYFHQHTKYVDDMNRVLSINWCTKNEDVSLENLMAKHRSLAESASDHIIHWGIASPAWGIRQGDVAGEFAHFTGYPDITAALAEQQDIAAKGDWKERRDYFDSYATCSGENLWRFDLASMPAL
ncbi:MAG: hypothetical protein P8L31_07365 [Pseudomonadales bacterium]|jgi:hypothetical protein|nr:hypothetical protein [Pseudomonadales bacterium]